MPTWTIPSKKEKETDLKQKFVWIFDDGFYIESCELELFEWGKRDVFINSIKQDKLPEALVESPNYPGDYFDYCFEDKKNEKGTSLAWRNYESEEVELKEYDREWSNLYQQEYKNIVTSLQIDEHYQPLLLEMEHIGSTSVKGMCAKPIIDMLLVQGNVRDNCGPTKYHETIKSLINMGYKPKYVSNFGCIDGPLIKKGFIIHIFQASCAEQNNFIPFREYLRAHPDARDKYNEYKKNLIDNTQHMTIKEYASKKDWFVNDLLKKAVEWYRQHKNYVHIGDFDDVKKRWSCCNASKDEENHAAGDSIHPEDGNIGCCQPGLEKDSYHPGRYCNTEYNFVRGWWECCSQGQYANGCVKLILLANGDVLLKDCEKWGINSVCRWVKSLKDINKDYSNNFRQQGINGRLLLTLVDDAVLQDLGVTTVLHRKIFLKAIDDLKGLP